MIQCVGREGGGDDDDRVLGCEMVRSSVAVSELKGTDARCFPAIWVISVWSYMDTCTRESRIAPFIDSDGRNAAIYCTVGIVVWSYGRKQLIVVV